MVEATKEHNLAAVIQWANRGQAHPMPGGSRKKGHAGPSNQSSLGNISVSTGAAVSPGPICNFSACFLPAMIVLKYT